MLIRPLCEAVQLPPATGLIAEQVTIAEDAPAADRFLHFHDAAELVVFQLVDGVFVVDGVSHDIASGVIVFVPSMAPHDFILRPGPKRWTLIQFDPHVVSQRASLPGGQALRRPICATPPVDTQRRIEFLVNWLTEAAANPATVDEIRLLTELLLVLLAEVGVDQPYPTETPSIPPPLRLARVIERLQTAPGKPLPLEEAAGLCGLSTAYFSRRFKQQFGVTFGDYVQTHRLHLAARRIAATTARFSLIAFDLGFSSPSHFTARFRERFGVTPKQYRLNANRHM